MSRVEKHQVGILIAGGTIDKIYNPSNGSLGFGGESRIPEILDRANLAPGLIKNIGHIMLLDSLDMGDNDRQAFLRAAQSASDQRLVGTHGTDTMVKTATVLGEDELLKEQGKTIVLVGAMTPESVGATEPYDIDDAKVNLGHAIASAQLLPSGVYISMNGIAHPYDEVWKNTDTLQFEAIEAEPYVDPNIDELQNT